MNVIKLSRARLLLCLLSMGSLCAQESADRSIALDALTQGAKLWQLTPEQAEGQFGRQAHLQWLSKDAREHAMIKRQPYSNVRQELKIAGDKLEVEEVTLDFASGKLAKLAFSLWNRGDSRESLDEKAFKKRIVDTTAALDGVFGVKATDQGVDRTSAVKFSRMQWMSDSLAAQLEYSGSKVQGGGWQAEFIRLRIVPPLKRAAVGAGPATIGGNAMNVSRADLVKNVQTDAATGEVTIVGVPMVDQGMKGYCAVASCQRIFNYYGMNVDEHEMAQVAETGAAGGTSSAKLMQSLDQLEGKLKVHFKKVYDLMNNKEMSAMVSDYNRISRKHGASPLEWYNADLGEMNPDDLRDARSRGADYNKFQKSVKQSIDKGVPLLWSLHLGLYPENGEPALQNGGGHMRIIIGYNFKDPAKPTLIFTDSWGAGHEKKVIAMADAFAATTGLISVEPQK